LLILEKAAKIAAPAKTFLTQVGELAYFTKRFFVELTKSPYEFGEFVRQCYQIGNRSLPMVAVTAFIIGMVFALQSRPTLEEFGAVSWMSSMVSISIVREIGPIITALICAARVSSGISAEIGAMRVSEQIDAMDVSGTNPFRYLVVTRVLAAVFMVPLLVITGDVISIYASYLVEHFKGNVSMQLYFNEVFEALKFSDIVPAVIKTFFFGFAIGLIGCYKGYTCKKGTAGVGIAANTAVVLASMLLFVIDFVAVFVSDIVYH
jgi:phospholipid/cholesterol/gamma-HCH transport system permease protein